MPLSVIVTSYESPAALRRCLESLAAQPEAAEIVVADCSAADPTPLLAPYFPIATFLHFDSVRTVPQLRWAAFERTRGELVAAVEARCVPASNWCAELVRAHANAPDAPAIGGPVELARPASARDAALYFCEYGLFAPPLPAGDARRLSGANLSYKRDALEESRDLLRAGEWETLLHERWRSAGRRLTTCGALVVFEGTLPAAATLSQRFHYGRGYAADRLRGAGIVKRLAYAAATPLLPLLLVGRLARAARRSGHGGEFLRSLPWIVLYSAGWSAGELAGYLFGASNRPRIF